MSELDKIPGIDSFAGQWVAIQNDKIIGTAAGGQESQLTEPGEQLDHPRRFFYVEANNGTSLNFSPLMESLRKHLTGLEQPIYLVGGAVRDVLLGQPQADLDFVVPNKAISLTFQIANAIAQPAYVLDKKRDAGRIVFQDEKFTLDLARFRGPDLTADLFARDFTINAIAMPATATKAISLIDPTNGQADLAAGLIRLTHDNAIEADPIRALRAVRMALAFEFTIVEETARAIKKAAHRLTEISEERLRDELLKLLALPSPDKGIQQLAHFNLLTVVLPEVALLANRVSNFRPQISLLEQTLAVLHQLSFLEKVIFSEAADSHFPPALADMKPLLPKLRHHLAKNYDGQLAGHLLLRVAALLHLIGPEPAAAEKLSANTKASQGVVEAALRRLRFSNQAISHLQKIIQGRQRPFLLTKLNEIPALPTQRAIHRFYRQFGSAGLDICLMALATELASKEVVDQASSNLVQIVVSLLANYFDHHQEIIAPTPFLDGREIMQLLDLAPGPKIGRLLRLLTEAQAAGEIKSHAEAVQFLRDAI